ncbi:uncharacterized protein LOC127841973 isoform X1 [Dreissena polymorpha]|uniref:NACHT domain-containing protein n=1 Tax=Dreissena polymorpha TaxID=45954 RepID=A0A9D4F2B6_DREPO|nr:uncharacterized protein LOC127841973 isoform X1 [Dreissena polymorpha]KAH3791065.1 hypothetical protein DPMN_169276 [Dreissena polymorpha]
MANLADVFTESERTNWLKALLAINIAKSGLEQFAENEAKTLHGNIYNAILTSGAVACTGCQTANLLKCPSLGICKKRGAQGLCTSVHDTASKQPRPCPANVCNKVLNEIAKQHKYHNPSWKNTVAIHWASNPWEIAKAYFPPEGYAEKASAQDTDFNGIISFFMNCKHFDNKFSFPIAPGKTHPPCLLTKARDIGRTVRHSSTCNVTDTDLQGMFITLTSLLTDQGLANDVAAQEAVRKLAKLQTDVLKLTTEETINLLESARNELKKVEHITKNITKAMDEMRIYIENCRKDLNAHTDKCKMELDEHTGKCKEHLEKHRQKSTETDYTEACKVFRRRLMAHYDFTFSNIPLSNLDQSLDKRIVDIYATPNIHRIQIEKDGKRIKHEQVRTYTDIFYTDREPNRRIYLQGEPGSGKSTFSAKLVHDWSHGIQLTSATPSKITAFDDVSTIQKFKFLFFVALRDSKDQADVTQMIKKQLIDTTYSEDERADVYKLFVQIMNTEICFVIREGLDEWVSPDGRNLAEPSMAGFQNDKCTVLTTSRPWKLADERIKNSHIENLFEIKGISDPYAFSENIIRCLIDHSKDLKETSIKLQSFVEDRELESLFSSPMLYTLVICTWVNTFEEEEEHFFEESSRCALYTTLLESLCKKANSTTGYFNDSNPPPVHCFSSTSYLQPNIEHLDKLAEVACKLLFSSERESSIVFSDITLSNYFSPDELKVRKKFALKAGILTNRKHKSRTGRSNSFVHKTVQELLAAYHIACNTYVIDDVISRYLKLKNTSYLEISQVLIFLCGMNISAANKLSALMNQYDLKHCNRYKYDDEDCLDGDPCEFQRIIESGISEAVANKQEGILLKLSHFYIDESNIRELHDIWPTDTCNVEVLIVSLDMNDFLSSPALGESATHFEFNLSSCQTLRKLCLWGSGILLRDTASSVRSEFPICIVLNNADPAQCADTPPELPSITDIFFKRVTCSSTCLHSLFSTLLALNQYVECTLKCVITSCVEGSDICTKAVIGTNSGVQFHMHSIKNDSPGLWEALHGLNIISLSLDGYKDNGFRFNHTELFWKFLSSLTHLESLSLKVCDIPSLCKALHGMNIDYLSLRLSDKFQDLKKNDLDLLSKSLLSLIRMKTLKIKTPGEDFPGLWEALRGLNITSLSLSSWETYGLIVNHVESLSECVTS